MTFVFIVGIFIFFVLLTVIILTIQHINLNKVIVTQETDTQETDTQEVDTQADTQETDTQETDTQETDTYDEILSTFTYSRSNIEYDDMSIDSTLSRTYIGDINNNERCCFNTKFNCHDNECIGGLEKRCGELKEKQCGFQLNIACSGLDENECNNYPNSEYCTYSNNICNDQFLTTSYDINCNRYTQLKNNIPYYEYNCS